MHAEPDNVSARPHGALLPFVSRYHGYRYATNENGHHRGLPSTAMTMVIAFDEQIEVGWLDDAPHRDNFWLVASGLHTRPADIAYRSMQCGIQLDVTAAGCRRLFGIPMGALAKAMVHLDEVIPSRRRGWHDAIAAETSWLARFARLDDILLRLTADNDQSAQSTRPELALAFAKLESTCGRASIGAIADEVGLSRRRLTDLFTAEYGVGPKQLARIARFDRSKGLLSPTRSIADVAADCGYADQAHLTREWQALAGCSPSEWLREEYPLVAAHA